MSAASAMHKIGLLAWQCEWHMEEADRCRDKCMPGAALAHAMSAADCAQKAQQLSELVLRRRSVAKLRRVVRAA
jgi:hypothetical protein